MIGVTVGIGPGWKERAEESARRMSHYTGLECRVMGNWPKGSRLVHAYWAKLWAQTYTLEKDLLFFDADLLCMKPWNPPALLNGCDFAWCVDPSPQIPGECLRYGLEPRLYGNSGLMLVRSGCPLLDRAKMMYPGCGRWPEQTALNIAAQLARDVRVNTLPPTYNHLVRRHQHGAAFKGVYGEVCLHFVGLAGSAAELADIQRNMNLLED